jgi:asparagine synthase (glutamine-hydrolysing)
VCGILGLLAPGTQPDLGSQLDWLAHRGPDDAGCYTDADVYLGARRLSIIDVAGGHQPLSTADRMVWVVQNGEIYNYLELRAQLEARGQVFHTRSDTEVIAAAYEAWGVDCARHLRGIYAFAVWDARRRRLLLARDRFGVKPLYYVILPGGGLAFASEIRPLLGRLPAIRPDLAALHALFSVGFIPTPRTAFEGVAKLPAANILLAEAGGIQMRSYWDLPRESAEAPPANLHPRPAGPDPEIVAGFRQHLERAVVEQRMSEVPLGALISGGIDSAAIAALLQAHSPDQLHTFNIGFEQAGYDETGYAALAAGHIGTQHHQVLFREADFDRYPEVLEHLEEPQCSATALPIYLLYQACREAGLTVILTGEGADELLGGYHWYQGDAIARRLLGLPGPARRLLAASPLNISDAGRRVLRSGEPESVARYALWQGVGEGAAVLAPEVGRQPQVIASWREAFSAGAAGRDAFRQLQYFDTHTRLVDFINFEVDRMSMAHSIEARVPFLDHELWEFVGRLPSAAVTGGRAPKEVLRRAMQAELPAETLARRKQGLAAPHAAWLRRARLPDWAETLIDGPALSRTGYFDPAGVGRLRAEHQAGGANHSRVLMGVLSTQLWHTKFIG